MNAEEIGGVMLASGKVLTKEQWYGHSPEVVWSALTNGEALAQWLMPNDFVAEAGRKFEFRVDPMMGFTGVIECEVLEIEPPTRMVWSWVTRAREGKKGHPPLRIEWSLTPEGSGTRLTLKQWGSEGMPWFWRVSMAMGWGTMMKRWLPKVLERFERGDGELRYRRMERAPNRGHHKVRTVPREFWK